MDGKFSEQRVYCKIRAQLGFPPTEIHADLQKVYGNGATVCNWVRKKPWYDSVIRRLSRTRDKQKRIVTKRGLLTDWEKYKFLRSKVNNLKRFAKQRYFSHLDECLSDSRVDNPQKYWKYLRSLVNANKKSDQVPILKYFEKM